MGCGWGPSADAHDTHAIAANTTHKRLKALPRDPIARCPPSSSQIWENIHEASGHATSANGFGRLTGRDPINNAVTTGVAANAAAGVAVVSFARLTGLEREPISVHLADPITVHVLDPISVHCLDGHLLARHLRNTGRQGHQ